MANGSDARRDHAAVGKRIDPDRDIQMLIDEIGIAVGKHEADVDLRITSQEVRH